MFIIIFFNDIEIDSECKFCFLIVSPVINAEHNLKITELHSSYALCKLFKISFSDIEINSE